MRRVVIESPYRAATAEEQARNTRYLTRALRDSLLRGEAPFASHAIYCGPLDDAVPEERTRGIEAGLTWGDLADAHIVYADHGISEGMRLAIMRSKERGQRVETRMIGAEPL